jgi:hypothetical protein
MGENTPLPAFLFFAGEIVNILKFKILKFLPFGGLWRPIDNF